jgi:hypothetical protein
VPSPSRPGKYANSQSSLGDTEMIDGGSYDESEEKMGSGEGSTNCFDEENRRAVTTGCVGWAVNIMEQFAHTIGLCKVSYVRGKILISRNSCVPLGSFD